MTTSWSAHLQHAAVNSTWRVRPAIAAFPAAIAITWLVREFFYGVGVDEMSLLAMGQALSDGALPYSSYWDVRMPLAYLWGWAAVHPSDAARSVAVLRLLAWFVQIGAVWLFFCMFQRTLGKPAAAVGAAVLAAAVNATPLHALGMPNHFAMALSVFAFACVVAGLRGSKFLYLAGALLAGALPWTMLQTGLLAAALGVLAVFGGVGGGRGLQVGGGGAQTMRHRPGNALRLAWLGLAAAPTALLFAIYAIAGHIDIFVRTAFAAPFEVMGGGGGYRFFEGAEIARLLGHSPWVPLQVLVLAAGALWLPGAVRAAPPGSALRASPWFVLPTAAGFFLMAYAKPPAPAEYWIEFAPVVGLLCAVAASNMLRWRGFQAAWLTRHARPSVLKPCLAIYLGCVLVLPADPWTSPPDEKGPLPQAFCDALGRALDRLGPEETVLDTVGLCSFQILDAEQRLQPPFTFTPMWLRQLDLPWIGVTFSGDGSRAAAIERLQSALAPHSPVGAILADGRLLGEVRQQGWRRQFHADWRMVWFRRVEGRDLGEEFARLAIFVRR